MQKFYKLPLNVTLKASTISPQYSDKLNVTFDDFST